MTARVFLLEPAACLISALIENLAALTQEELRATILLMPTQRLGTYTLAGLLRKHRALEPPRIMTLENLLQEAAPTDRRVIGDSGIDLLLGRLLSEGEYTHLRPGHERELRLLHGEMYEHGIRDEAMEKLKTAIRDDIYKSEPHLGSLYDRAVEIEHALMMLDLVLEERGLITRSAQLARTAAMLADRWQTNPIPAQRYVMAAYTSLASSWQILLSTWLKDERFNFWLSEAPQLYHPSSPLKELIASIRAEVPCISWSSPPSVGGSTISTVAPTGTRQIYAAVASSIVDETAWALAGAEALISSGFSPEKVAILVTDEKHYAGPIEAQLTGSSLRANVALARSWASSLPGRCLRAIERFWHEKESMGTLLTLLDHPLIERRLGEDQSWAAAEAEASMALLKESLLRSGIPGSLERAIATLKDPWCSCLKSLQSWLEPLHPRRMHSLSEWVATLEAWADSMNLWEVEEESDLINSCREGFENFLETLRMLGDAGHPIDGRSFWQLFDRHLLETDIRRTGEPLAGLQILILSEARYFPFQAAFLLGCQEGSFPKGLPQDELLDNYLKKAMGLPGWEVLEAMEDQTFHLLKARIPHLLLLRSESLGEEALVRSRFIEALVVKTGLKEEALPSSRRQERKLSASEELALEAEGRVLNDTESLHTPMAASRLEKLIRCPYAFLLSSLDVRGLDPPPPWGDSRREGEWLHGVLEALISGCRGSHRYIEAWRPSADLDIESEALSRLRTLTEVLAPPELRESALFTHLQTHSWPAFARHLSKILANEPLALGSSRREYDFQRAKRQRPHIQVKERWRELIGRIDAVDPHSEFVTVTDYKRRTIPSGKSTREGIAPQLAFYALALAELEPQWIDSGLLLGYWNIYKGEWNPQAVSAKVRLAAITKDLASKDTPDLETLQEALLEIWAWREGEIEAEGRYYADPSECSLCSYSGICRKEDPRLRETLGQHDRLYQRRQGTKPHAESAAEAETERQEAARAARSESGSDAT